jgi:hypothetical protein
MVNASTVAKACQATRPGMPCTVESTGETKQTQKNHINTDQIGRLPVPVRDLLIRFFSVYLNL